jgi:hypothetical protein
MMVLLLAVCSVGWHHAAAAQTASPPSQVQDDSYRFGIAPAETSEQSWIEVSVEAGSAIDKKAVIVNYGALPVSLRTYVTNSFNPPNGGFAAGTDEEAPVGATLWVDYPPASFDLQPGETLEVSLTVAVPPNTPPGEYVAALVVQTAGPVPIPGTETFQQIIRSTMSVEITVPGQMMTTFELGEPVVMKTGTAWQLDIPVTNTGTARVRPGGQLTVTDANGREVVTSDVEMGSVYGGNTSSVQVFLPSQLPVGTYVLSISLTDQASGVTAAIESVPILLAEPEVLENPTFVVEPVAVEPNADPVQYADVTATITNNGPAIPTANVLLTVERDGVEVETYPLAQNQALAQGSTDFSQRYIPVDGWQKGTYTFRLVIASVNDGTQTVLATIDIPDTIAVP